MPVTDAARLPVAGYPVAPLAAPDAVEVPAPEVLRWDGQPQGWWSRNGLAFGLGAGFGAGAAIAGGMLSHAAGARTPVVAAIAAGAALVMGGATFGIASFFRSRADRVPDLPTGPARSLPAAGTAIPVVGGEAARGTHVGRADGSYLERVAVTKYRTGADGKTESYTDYELRRRYFDWSVSLESQVGRRDGYATMQEALEDTVEGDATAIRRQGDRLVAYDMQSRSHWGDIDDFVVYDQATEAVVSPSGGIWVRQFDDPEFHYSSRIDRPDPTGIHGQSIGEHELRYRGNPEVRVDTLLTGRRGHEGLPSALAELQARPGDQVVIEAGGRYHVADAISERLDRAIPNDGFVTTKHAERVVAVEQQGGIWTPNGDWYVAPKGA